MRHDDNAVMCRGCQVYIQSSKSKAEEVTDDRDRQQQASASLLPANSTLSAQTSFVTGNCGTGLAAKRQTLLDDGLSEDHLLALPPQSRAGTVGAA